MVHILQRGMMRLPIVVGKNNGVFPRRPTCMYGNMSVSYC